MDRNHIIATCNTRLDTLLTRYQDLHVPDYAEHYSRLLYLLITRSPDRYYSSYGWMPIDIELCDLAKQEIGEGPLSALEVDVANFLNKDIDKKESQPTRNLPVLGGQSTIFRPTQR